MSLAFENGPWKPELALVRAIDIRCEDCGRTRRMQAPAIARHVSAGCHSLIGLHDKLYCAVCRERGGLGKNLSLFPIDRGSA
ncbi:hypothetical protein [Bosea sp. BK604]|uniref:hypothetical protein n=1 Tax=Bosea sp. BK604 TaxID=2512180 RepID=UPI001046E5F2|nr:hypothetical protein [Bosea sp. BK604]TCR63196.1 hypothetical protein EV560_109290 [Bosea sp. BK604]